MNTIEVCYTPELMHLFSLENATVVVVDIFRATSCIVTGLAEGIPRIAPVEHVEETAYYAKKGYLRAGERSGIKLADFDLGNSPFEYKKAAKTKKNIVVTTTNGTRSIKAATNGSQVIIGSFLNIDRIASYLVEEQHEKVLILCAGWKGRYNIEDSLFAGNLADELLCSEHFETQCDSTLSAQALYRLYANNFMEIIWKASHMKRLGGLAAEKDVAFCLKKNQYVNIPVYDGQFLVNL